MLNANRLINLRTSHRVQYTMPPDAMDAWNFAGSDKRRKDKKTNDKIAKNQW